MEKFTGALLVAMLGRGRLTRRALRKVVKERLLPSVRERTPVGETGNARAGWKIGKEGETKRGRLFIEVVNPVFYIRFLEFGTLGARKKKLKKKTGAARRRKAAEGKTTIGAGLSGGGGIRPIRMLGTTMRDLRAKRAVPTALNEMFQKGIRQAKREAESVRA